MLVHSVLLVLDLSLRIVERIDTKSLSMFPLDEERREKEMRNNWSIHRETFRAKKISLKQSLEISFFFAEALCQRFERCLLSSTLDELQHEGHFSQYHFKQMSKWSDSKEQLSLEDIHIQSVDSEISPWTKDMNNVVAHRIKARITTSTSAFVHFSLKE